MLQNLKLVQRNMRVTRHSEGFIQDCHPIRFPTQKLQVHLAGV